MAQLVHTAKLSTCQIRGSVQTTCKDPGSCQPMLYSLPRPHPCRHLPDDLVADHEELVLRPQFWLYFALGFRLKPQVCMEKDALVWKEVMCVLGCCGVGCPLCALPSWPDRQGKAAFGAPSLPLKNSRMEQVSWHKCVYRENYLC